MKRLWMAILVVLIGCSSHRVDLSVQAPATLRGEPPGFEKAVVTRIVDGDTIEVRVTSHQSGPGRGAAIAGKIYPVRLIGIDTPESVKRGAPVECFGREAAAAMGALLDGRSVLLVKDVEDQDRYGRLLRYVYIGEEMANARLVANGYAYAYTYPPDVRHADLFVQLQRQARVARRGLWHQSACER